MQKRHTPRPPDIRVTLRGPVESEAEADRRLRAVLKRLLRNYGYRAVDLREVEPSNPNPRGTQHDPA